jgi:hypothetical protein
MITTELCRGGIRRAAADGAASRPSAPVHREDRSVAAKIAAPPRSWLGDRGIAPFAVEFAPAPRNRVVRGAAPKFTVEFEISA